MFTQFAAEYTTGDDLLSKLPASEREKLRAQISHLHKNLNHASPTVMAETLKRRRAHDLVTRAARTHHCLICEQYSRHPLRPVAATQLHTPMRCLEIENFEWATSSNKTEVSRNVHCLLFHTPASRCDTRDKRTRCGIAARHHS